MPDEQSGADPVHHRLGHGPDARGQPRGPDAAPGHDAVRLDARPAAQVGQGVGPQHEVAGAAAGRVRAAQLERELLDQIGGGRALAGDGGGQMGQRVEVGLRVGVVQADVGEGGVASGGSSPGSRSTACTSWLLLAPSSR